MKLLYSNSFLSIYIYIYIYIYILFRYKVFFFIKTNRKYFCINEPKI